MEEKRDTLSNAEVREVAGGASNGYVYCCGHCDEYFDNAADYQRHLETAHGIITCPMCHHPMNKNGVCEICGYAGRA